MGHDMMYDCQELVDRVVGDIKEPTWFDRKATNGLFERVKKGLAEIRCKHCHGEARGHRHSRRCR